MENNTNTRESGSVKPKRKIWQRWWFWAGLSLDIMLIACVVVYFFGTKMNSAPDDFPVGESIEITEGTSVKVITQILTN